MAVGQAQAAFATVIAANQLQIAAFLALPCVTDGGKGNITSLQSGTAQALSDTVSEYNDYMAFVTKPMVGNGKCDGGFQGVAVESGRRKARSLQGSNRIYDVESAYHGATVSSLFSPVIQFNDSGGEDCMKTAGSMYESLEAGAKSVEAGIHEIHKSMLYEADRFAAFQAQNNALRVRCGDSQELSSGQIRSVAGQGSATGPVTIPQGDSDNPVSDISGTQEDAAKRAKAFDP